MIIVFVADFARLSYLVLSHFLGSNYYELAACIAELISFSAFEFLCCKD